MNQKQSEADAARVDAEKTRRQQPGAQGTDPADAIAPNGDVDAKKLKENQDRLQVNDEHKTPEMQKGHRGTFP